MSSTFSVSDRTIRALGYCGLFGAILVGRGEYFLHYSPKVLESAASFQFFQYVSIQNLKLGHFLAVAGLPFYFAGYMHLYLMLRSGSETLARAVLVLGWLAFSVGGIWIGSRGFVGTIVHMQGEINSSNYDQIIQNYKGQLEILVQILRVVVLVLSVAFVWAILHGGTYYKKWMVAFNPVLILLLTFSLYFIAPGIGKHIVPIAMNSTHFILFTVSLYHFQHYCKRH